MCLALTCLLLSVIGRVAIPADAFVVDVGTSTTSRLNRRQLTILSSKTPKKTLDDATTEFITKDELKVLLEIEDGDDILVDRIILCNPLILKRRRETISDRICELEEELGLNRTEIVKAVTRPKGINLARKCDNYEGDDTAEREVLRWLKDSVNLTDAQIKRAVKRRPNFLQGSVERLETKVAWLRSRLNITTTDDETRFRNFISQAPNVISGSTLEATANKIDWLQRRLLIDDVKLRKILLQYTAILNFSVDNLESKFVWMKERFKLTEEQSRKLLACRPGIFNYNMETNVEPKLLYFRDRFSLDDKGVASMVLKVPSLLSYSIDRKLEPTIEFFAKLLGREEAALKLIARYPTLLTYSLEKRLRPRLAEVQELGLGDKISICTWAMYPPASWEALLENQISKMNQEDHVTHL